MKSPRTSCSPAAPPNPAGAKQSFARALARAEFGRFYWNDELAEEVRRACLAVKKPAERK